MTETYRRSIETPDWMGPATRREALDKLATIRAKVGYPENGRTYDALTVQDDDLVGNIMRARAFDYRYWIAKIGQKVDRAEWFAAPQTVNAFYNPNQNEILFPAGILQPPFFDAGADDAANYGGIGVVIGHEISHAFDDQGSRYDGTGNLRNWWTDADRAAFEKKTHGMIAQNWKSKIRDAASIERLKTDPHSPGQFRANGAVRNQTAFDEAFDVKTGDGMYLPPEQRITLW